MIIDVKVPQLSESVAEATLVSWHKKAGEAVARDENLIDIETDKVVLELPAPDSGVLVEIVKGDGDTVVAGEVIARIDTAAQAGTAPSAAPAAPSGTRRQPEAQRQPPRRLAPASPCRRRARSSKRRHAAGDVAGTGRGGRVTKSDALAAQAPAASVPAAGRQGQPPSRRVPRHRPPRAAAGPASPCRSATGPSSACRCHACARASPSACCSRRRATPS
jgi:2-oxoglutarate dehydrogenase E2 component (dihydrolipoamide succinyltransferase)